MLGFVTFDLLYSLQKSKTEIHFVFKEKQFWSRLYSYVVQCFNVVHALAVFLKNCYDFLSLNPKFTDYLKILYTNFRVMSGCLDYVFIYN